MDDTIAKKYDPKVVEDRLYDYWLEKGFFKAQADYDKKPFTIVIPPPNITGQLHMGHALDNTIQDILIRWKRMQGYSALWLPGTDHASIATEVRIMEQLAKEGVTKYDLGREKFLERAWKWKEEYGGIITDQLKKLGSSCDWSRERFTLDEGCNKAVTEVFVRLYEKGLIYRGDRIINWCPACKTALSDAEVEHKEQRGYFWHIRYYLKDTDDHIVIATTRPETMLGDTAVAVNPNDDRYRGLVGKTLILPLVNREIPIISDEYVDMEFGTGMVKITPAHDPNDFQVGMRHDLPVIKVMEDDGTMNQSAGKYSTMDRYDARKAILIDLQEQGLLVDTEDHVYNLGHCYRCSTIVEPIVSKQWFVTMKPLAEPALEVVKNDTIKFIPERFEKIYNNWMENILDWCISRQLWWGHRIPAYYCVDCNETIVSRTKPIKCSGCGCEQFKQDSDVLDTWFSSALWPFSTLGWPDETEDLEYFYPTDVLVTGYDIIFFWVARMIFSGMEHMKQEPFKYVFIHGIIRDSQGRKMSKSLGNGVDPLELIEKYGADALRFSLITGNSPGNDMRFYWERVESSRNFANKIWNASRFILMNMEDRDYTEVDKDMLYIPDRWIISRYNSLVQEVTENLNRFELGIAVQKLYDFIWSEFCDWYIEIVKPRLYGEDKKSKDIVMYTLSHVLGGTLKLLHPFMPFLTEEIWQHFPRDRESIMISRWPEYDEIKSDEDAEQKMSFIMEVVKEIRNIRADMNVNPGVKAKALFVVASDNARAAIEIGVSFMERLAGISQVEILTNKDNIPKDAVSAMIPGVEIFIPLDELIDRHKEIERLTKESNDLEMELKRVDGKLTNESFISKAPPQVVEKEKQKKAEYKEMMAKVLERLKTLKN